MKKSNTKATAITSEQLTECTNTTDNKHCSKNNGKGEIKFTEIKDTPFQIVSKDGLHFGILGNSKITEVNEDINVIREYLCNENMDYDKITKLIITIVTNMKAIENELKNATDEN
jgi:hypothetical protein